MSDINYRQVLEDLRARRSKLDTAIAAIEEIVSTTQPANLPQLRLQSREIDGPTPVAAGPYTGKTIIAATIEFLRTAGKPQHIAAILINLKRGGLSTNSKNFYRTVYNTLNNNLDKAITRDAAGNWGLKEWES